MSKSEHSKRFLYLIIGPVLFIAASIGLSGLLTPMGAKAVGTMLWMVFWWVTRPIDMTVTAFLPVIVNALFNIVPMEGIIKQYASESVVLIFGSCLLVMPWMITGLDRRIALKILSIIGPSMRSQITVWFVSSMVMSSFVPNVAVCALFSPIAIAMFEAIRTPSGGMEKKSLATPILLAIGWTSVMGGVGSPLGGAMNVTAISFLEEMTGHEFMYVDWIIRILPYFIASTVVTLIVMILIFARGNVQLEGTKEFFEKSYQELGAMKREEKICMALFLITMAAVFTRPLYANILPALTPAYVFMITGFALFLFTTRDRGLMMSWDHAQKNMMWGMMLLFGGGLALGNMINGSGATAGIAEIISKMQLQSGLLAITVFVVFATVLAELGNSTVSAAIMIPLVLGLTTRMGWDPIPYWFATIMGFNGEFLLPISVRAIAVGYGVDPNVMMKTGIPMVIARMITAIVVAYLCMELWPAFSHLSYI